MQNYNLVLVWSIL